MATEVAICNLALVHIGQGVAIASLTERSEAAIQCAALLPFARDGLLRDCALPFATRRVGLAPVTMDLPAAWAYAYRLPNDCARALELVDVPHGTPWIIEGDDAGGLILCNIEDAVLRYTTLVTDVNRWPVDAAAALAWRLAVDLADTIAQDAGRSDRARQGYARAIDKAIANAAAEGLESPPDYTPPGLERT